jgi:hypothetical protein
MARKKASVRVRPDGLAPTVADALGHPVGERLEALYRVELRLRDFFRLDSRTRRALIGSHTRRALSPFSSLWKRDPLAIAGLGSAAFAFLLWAWLGCVPSSNSGCLYEDWFSPERLPAVAVFLALSLILLLLRRR